jgi:membrane protease subunit HflC
MKPVHILIAIVVLVALWLVGSSCYSVSEQEQVIITRFGQPQGKPVTDAGLHFKTPFVEDVNRFEKRIIQWDGPSSEMPTKDKLYIVVDSFARWRITDPLQFFQSLRDERSAQSRLDDILGSEVRNVVARHDLIEVVRTSKTRKPTVDDSTVGQIAPTVLPAIQFGREVLEKEILTAASPKVKSFGIELLDLRFKRINYNTRVSEKIYDRMTSERTQIAERFRSEGAGESAKIMGKKEKDLREIESGAYRKIQEIQGKADAEAMQIYSKAYNTSPEAADFFQFIKTLETYKSVLGRDTTVVFTTESDLFKYLKRLDGGNGPKKIVAPQPKPAAAPAPAPVAPPQQ